MTWGTFGIIHIITIILAVLINVALYQILKRTSLRTQRIVLGILSFAGIAAILFNLLAWNSPLEYLPFHLCSLSAMVLPFATLLRSERLGNLLLLWSLGALFAIIVNYAAAEYELFSWTFFFYYFPHVLELGIPIILLKLKHIRLNVKCIISTLIITMVSYTLIHLINVWINAHCIENNLTDYAGNIIQVNYMFSITPENPLLQLFHSIIPHPYWYMFLAIPVAALYLGAIYGIHALVVRRRAAKASQPSA